MSECDPNRPEAVSETVKTTSTGKRSRQTGGDARYPRKRSVRACHVCRSRKTKCDNVQPICGFCASLKIPCSYDDAERDHSSFDPATLEILRELGRITESQDELLQRVRNISASQLQPTTPGLPHSAEQLFGLNDVGGSIEQQDAQHTPSQLQDATHGWLGPQPDSASSTPAASTNLAAIRWFGVLTGNASYEALCEPFPNLGIECGFLDRAEGQSEDDLTPLQRATRAVDGRQPSSNDLEERTLPVEATGFWDGRLSWQSADNITLLPSEQVLFANFVRRICSWFELFDPNRTFSARVPHLAVKNAGLLNAILALSSYHLSLGKNGDYDPRSDQRAALQYYYQTLHYVQKAMQYSSYWNSLDLTATAIIVSTYEMLHGSSNDWQRHLRGVFWILRSRQIEVEQPSLESTTWWAWLQQDIWAAFRGKRRTYSTWTPKKTCRQLESHELAARALWILAQVVNFCASDFTSGAASAMEERISWTGQLQTMLREWESCLTVEFSPLPAQNHDESGVFEPRLIYPQCYALAMQAHHASQLLLWANEPFSGRTDLFVKRRKEVQESVEMVCGIGLTLTDDAPSLLSSQYVFIAGLFALDSQQRHCIFEMLDSYQERCRWPLVSLGTELKSIHSDPSTLWTAAISD